MSISISWNDIEEARFPKIFVTKFIIQWEFFDLEAIAIAGSGMDFHWMSFI
jgi:hypothetical protein